MPKAPTYPPSHRVTFEETIHGRVLTDPFHWLEGDETGEIAAWTKAQQAMTGMFIGQTPDERRIRNWLTQFLGAPFVFHAFDAGHRRFLLEDVPGKEQPRLLCVDRDGNCREIVDPNAIRIDASPAILDQESIEASPTGRHVAYSLRTADSPGCALFVREVETGSVEPVAFPANVLPRVSWHPGVNGFFYNQCQGEFIPHGQRATRPDGIYWHQLGNPLSADALIHAKDWPDAHATIPAVSDDGRFLFVNTIRLVANTCRLRALKLDAEGRIAGPAIALGPDGEGGFCYIGSADGIHYFETDIGAPNGRVIGFDLRDENAPRLFEAVREQHEPLCISPRAGRAERSVLMNRCFYLTYLDGSGHILRQCNLDGGNGISSPSKGTAIAGSGGDRFGRLSAAASNDALLADLWCHTAPPRSVVYDTVTGAMAAVATNATAPGLTGVVVETVTYRSKDGTPVPITVLSRGTLPRDGTRPCLLYGYGGWGMPIVPEFGLDIVAWLALGGVYAIANIRGGGEFGARWHEAGKGAQKQKVFDDFIAAAEFLVAEGVTRPQRLAIRGLSNGGLLVGACLTQRPDLFGAAVAELPLLDPLRMGRDHWSAQVAPELGNPAVDADAFDVIARYSPLENLRDGIAYPPTLVVAADKDAQLLMDGARKFVATLQSGTPDSGPHLLHIVRDAAHGGWSKSQQIDTTARELAFLVRVLGIDTAPLIDFDDSSTFSGQASHDPQ